MNDYLKVYKYLHLYFSYTFRDQVLHIFPTRSALRLYLNTKCHLLVYHVSSRIPLGVRDIYFYFNSQMNRNIIMRNNNSSEQVRFQRLSVLVSAQTKSNTDAGRGTLYWYRSRGRITTWPATTNNYSPKCFFSTLLFITSLAQFRKEFSFNTFLVPTSDTGFPVPGKNDIISLVLFLIK